MMFEPARFDALAIGAHPDDVEICCGGTMARLVRQGYRVGILTVTSAELGSRGDSTTRGQEFAKAARILGVHWHRMLNIPDGHVRASRENKLKLIRILRELRPRVVFTHHWLARHPDHSRTSELVQEAAFQAGLAKIDTGQPPWRPYKLVFFANRYEFRPSFVVDITETFEIKMQAVQAYHSQFYHPDMEKYGKTETAISHPAFLEHIEIRARQYGVYIGTRFAEPFSIREYLAIADPIALFDEKCWYAIP